MWIWLGYGYAILGVVTQCCWKSIKKKVGVVMRSVEMNYVLLREDCQESCASSSRKLLMVVRSLPSAMQGLIGCEIVVMVSFPGCGREDRGWHLWNLWRNRIHQGQRALRRSCGHARVRRKFFLSFAAFSLRFYHW
jgi:hypothetical protein